VAPSKTPPPVLARLESEIDAILKKPDVQKRFTELGAEPGTMSGPAFGQFLAEETAKWTGIIQSSGASIN
jgi:tripartite-type tricarboxylate transporter receptor subunit TctC